MDELNQFAANVADLYNAEMCIRDRSYTRLGAMPIMHI